MIEWYAGVQMRRYGAILPWGKELRWRHDLPVTINSQIMLDPSLGS